MGGSASMQPMPGRGMLWESRPRQGGEMRQRCRILVMSLGLLLALGMSGPASAQKQGGTLRVYHRDSPASMSIHEEATWSTIMPMMGVFNNLVLYDQHIRQNSLATIRPELATSWSWNEDGTELTFKLRRDVKWHDGKPFTAADVKCTWDLLLGRGKEKLRLNPRETWYLNLADVTTKGEDEATFHMKRPQPAFLALHASGDSPVYPCHVSPREMRAHPIDTGPFKFVDYKPNPSLKLERNPDYWKPGLPHLDAIEYTIVPNRSTAVLGFIAGTFDMTFPHEITVPLLKDIHSQAPQAICETVPLNVSVTVAVNRKPPFDDIEARRAVAMALDRQAFIDILGEGQGDVSAVMLPPPEGIWGIPLDMLRPLPGYALGVEKSREEGRAIIGRLGYGPEKPLKVTVSGSAVDDPDQIFYESYVCKSPRNYTSYCNPEVEMLIDKQSVETDPETRKRIVWDIERRRIEEGVRPVIYHARQATCWQPQVKNITMMVNSAYNGWRMEDVWLEK